MSDKKLLTVIGATGAQGGSVIDHVLSDHNHGFAIRAVTRNPNSRSATQLATRGVEVVQADTNDLASLISAFAGSYAIFAVTDFWSLFAGHEKDEATAIETRQGMNMVDAAEATGSTLQHYVWSTLADTERITEKRCSVPHYQSKVAVDHYIQSKPELLAKTTFLWCSFYASNFTKPFLAPVLVPGIDRFSQLQSVPSDTPMAFIGDTRVNFGAFVKAALAQPDKTLGGKVVFAYVQISTLGELLQAWAKARGVDAQYMQVFRDDYYALFSKWGEEMDLGMKFWYEARDRDWITGTDVLNYKDLNIDLGELVDTKRSFKEL